MKNIRIEYVGDIHYNYPYLEIFFNDDTNPFLEIAISDTKELSFKFCASKKDVKIKLEDLEYIVSVAKDYLPKTLKNEDDFFNFMINQ